MRTFFDVSSRVLLCDHCGAPLEAPPQGGTVACRYCRTQNHVPARSALRAGAIAPRPGPAPHELAAQINEVHRIAALKAQDHQPLVPPKSVRQLLAGSSIRTGMEEQALRAFQQRRAVLSQASNPTAEVELYFWSIVFANHFGGKSDFLRVRAMLESALEVMESPRHRQVVMGLLARTAARLGELDAAKGWLAMCDPQSADLQADTAYRLTVAFIAACEGRHADVLNMLGRTEGQIPISDENDNVCAIIRADAIERSIGVEPAIRELVAVASKRIGAWPQMVIIRAHNQGSNLTLCPESFPRAEACLPFHRRSAATVPVGCVTVFALLLVPFVVDSVAAIRGERSEFGFGGPVIVLVLTLLLGPFVLALLRNWGALRRRLKQARGQD